jgi:hypothetical protein
MVYFDGGPLVSGGMRMRKIALNYILRWVWLNAPKFTSLTIINFKLSKKYLVALFEALAKNKHIKYVCLNKVMHRWENDTIEETFQAFQVVFISLALAVKQNRTMTSLDLSANLIRGEGVVQLADALAHNLILRRLILIDVPTGVDDLAEVVRSVSSPLQHAFEFMTGDNRLCDVWHHFGFGIESMYWSNERLMEEVYKQGA